MLQCYNIEGIKYNLNLCILIKEKLIKLNVYKIKSSFILYKINRTIILQILDTQ